MLSLHRSIRAACALAAIAFAACDDECEPGTETCACFPNQTCNGELSCASGFCVDLNAAADGGGRTADGGGNAGTGASGAGSSAPRPDDGGSSRADSGPTGGSTEQGERCETTAECAPLTELCRMAVCLAGVCSSVTKPVGTLIDDPIAGDCQRLRCAAGGEIAAEADPTDLPEDDADPCTESGCDGANAVQRPAPAGTATPDSSQTDGDCLRVVCDGEGGVTSEVDNGDPPPAPGGNACEVGSCDGGSTGTEPAPAGTPCEDRVCDGAGECVECKANGAQCSGGAECCGGLCQNGMCATCPAMTGDCDRMAANGCETSITTVQNCRACGNDCMGRPQVSTATCAADGCRVSRCQGGRADVDGDFENGCEAEAEVGDQPYAHCTGANAAEVCGVGERCISATLISGLLIQVGTCSASGAGCFCAFPCTTAADCPSPTGGTATKVCNQNSCMLQCTSSPDSCPSGMRCITSTFVPTIPSACVYN